MTSEQKDNEIPEWARRERWHDMEWVNRNVLVLWPLAVAAFATFGRGALAADVAASAKEDDHPLGYLTQAVFEAAGDEAMKRMVREYEPAEEFVMVFFKPDNRASTYRVRPVDEDGSGR